MGVQTRFFAFPVLLAFGIIGVPSREISFAEPAERLDLGVTDSYDKWVDLEEISRAGITRYNAYLSWRELEPTAGTYSWDSLDSIIDEAARVGVRVALEIEITDVGCTTPEHTDEECIQEKLPADLAFSRETSRFDEEGIVGGLGRLLETILTRYDPEVLTHVFVGNETDSYLQVVQEASEEKINLFPSFLNLLRKLREKIDVIPEPRPQFGTAFKFNAASSYYHEEARSVSEVVEVMGFTVYPTDPDWGDETPLEERVKTWLDALRAVPVTEIAITEIGASALPPFGSPDDQAAFARSVIEYLNSNPDAFEFVSWFSLYDNASLRGTFFEGTGLETLQGERDRPPKYGSKNLASKNFPVFIGVRREARYAWFLFHGSNPNPAFASPPCRGEGKG